MTFNNSGNSFAGMFNGNGGPLTNLNAGYLSHGFLASDRLWGSYSNALIFSNRTNSFTGDGSGLTNLNASALTSGLVPTGRLTGTYSATLVFANPSNRFTGKFFGDGSMLTNFSYTFTGTNFAGSGFYLTDLNADNIAYGTIPDTRLSTNIVRARSDPKFGTVSADAFNANGNVVAGADLLGGRLNVGLLHTLGGSLSSIAGGTNNVVTADLSSIAGGRQNTVTSGDCAFIGGGEANAILSGGHGVIAGGLANHLNADFSFIGGGFHNAVAGSNCVIVGGFNNYIATNYCATISGGDFNLIGDGGTNGWPATIGGGYYNAIQSDAGGSTLGGGVGNTVQTNTYCATIAGGFWNTIQTQAMASTIGGGDGNTIQAKAAGSTIGGGGGNTIRMNAESATIPGGANNEAGGWASFAAGSQAHALHDGTFVWADVPWGEFVSTGSGQFLVRAHGGVGINTNSPQATLHVNGTVRATTYYGDGSQLTGIVTGGTISNALYLGGIPASAYATNGHTHSATAITSGTLADARLSANVALLDSSATFSGTVTANGLIVDTNGSACLGCTNCASPARLAIQGKGSEGDWIDLQGVYSRWHVNNRLDGLCFGNAGDPQQLFLVPGGNVGIDTYPIWKLDVNGDLHTAGDVLAGGALWGNPGGGGMCRLGVDPSGMPAAWLTSDERLKRDIAPIPNAVETLRKLSGVTWHWNDAGLQHLTRDIETSWKSNSGTPEDDQKLWDQKRREAMAELAKPQMGFIAQEVEQVYPDWVKTDDRGYKQVNLEHLNAVLVNAVKEQQTEIETLKARLARLEQLLSARKGDGQ